MHNGISDSPWGGHWVLIGLDMQLALIPRIIVEQARLWLSLEGLVPARSLLAR